MDKSMLWGYTGYPFLERQTHLFLRKGIYGMSLRKKKNRSRIWPATALVGGTRGNYISGSIPNFV